ncbi:462_t:CDS:2, partial [Racocetra fulgida]
CESLIKKRARESLIKKRVRERVDLSDDKLECLRYWPSDTKIDDTISTSYKKAIHLARYLEITATPKDAYYFNIHKKFPTSLEDFWDGDSDLEAYNNKKFNTDSLSVSQSINYAVSEMNITQEEFNSGSRTETLIEKSYEVCQVIVEQIQ